jgi:hypothetical protein
VIVAISGKGVSGNPLVSPRYDLVLKTLAQVTYLAFATAVTPPYDVFATEKMRITSTGNVGIGTTGPNVPLSGWG